MLEPILVEKTKRTHKPNHKYIPTFLDDLTSKFMSLLSELYQEHIRTSCEFLRENTPLMPVILLLQSKIYLDFESQEDLRPYLGNYFSEKLTSELVEIDGFVRYRSKQDILDNITGEGDRYLYIRNYDRLDLNIINDILDVITDTNSLFKGILVDIVSDGNRFQASTPLNILTRMNVRIASIPNFSSIRKKCSYYVQTLPYMPMFSREMLEVLNTCTNSQIYLNYLKISLTNHWIENDPRKCFKIFALEINGDASLINKKVKKAAVIMLAGKRGSNKNAQNLVDSILYFKRVKAEYIKGIDTVLNYLTNLPGKLSLDAVIEDLFDQVICSGEKCEILLEYYGLLTSADMANKLVWNDYLIRLSQNYTISQDKCEELNKLYETINISPHKTKSTLTGKQRLDALQGKTMARDDLAASRLLKNEIKIMIDQLLEPFEHKLRKELKDTKIFHLYPSEGLNPDMYSDTISTLAYPPTELVSDISNFSAYEDISILFYLMAGAGKDIELNNIFDLYTKVRKDSELTIDQLQGRFLQTIDELIYTGFLAKSKRKGKKGEFWAEKRFFGHSTFTN